MRFDAPETIDGGGNFLAEPGTYHMVILSAEEDPTTANGKTVSGVQVKVVAMEGTTRDSEGKFSERDKTVNVTFFHPKLTDKNEGKFARDKQAALFIATGLMTHEQLGKSIDINVADMAGRQVIATLERDPKDAQYLRLKGTDIWHIDDPNAMDCPRCQKTLALMPPSLRRDPKSFPARMAPRPAKPSKPDASVNLDDL